MEPGCEELQVVLVTSSCRLLDARSVEHVYWRCDGLGLAPGWYVASWPPGGVAGRFYEETLFRGPFKQRRDAQAAMAQMRSRLPLRNVLTATPVEPARPTPAQPGIE
jgi:hypothetical protein